MTPPDYFPTVLGLDFEYVKPVARRIKRQRSEAAVQTQTATAGGSTTGSLVIELPVVAVSLVALIASARFVVAEAVWLADLSFLVLAFYQGWG